MGPNKLLRVWSGSETCQVRGTAFFACWTGTPCLNSHSTLDLFALGLDAFVEDQTDYRREALSVALGGSHTISAPRQGDPNHV